MSGGQIHVDREESGNERPPRWVIGGGAITVGLLLAVIAAGDFTDSEKPTEPLPTIPGASTIISAEIPPETQVSTTAPQTTTFTAIIFDEFAIGADELSDTIVWSEIPLPAEFDVLTAVGRLTMEDSIEFRSADDSVLASIPLADVVFPPSVFLPQRGAAVLILGVPGWELHDFGVAGLPTASHHDGTTAYVTLMGLRDGGIAPSLWAGTVPEN